MANNKVITLGCRLNTFESEVIRHKINSAGLINSYVVNTCAVTGEAVRQAQQTVRRLRRQNPQATIIVSGCAAQIDPDSFGSMPEVDRVIGNEEKLKAESYVPLSEKRSVLVSDIMEVRQIAGHMIESFNSRARAFLQIQQGCSHRCTFCIIPFGRGNSRSVPAEFLTNQARRLCENGYSEFVLTGVDISSYGADLPGELNLGRLVRLLLTEVPEIKRLRLSSLDPASIDSTLITILGEETRFMPHLHLSVQAGDDLTLKRMKRRHSRSKVIKLCEKLRQVRPDLIFGADLIAGFPTETDEMFANTLRLVNEAGLTFLHVFPYSERIGTPATRMPQVPNNLRRERADILRNTGERIKSKFFDGLIGSRAEVLIEPNGRGYTEHYAPVRLNEHSEESFVKYVRLTSHDGKFLEGDIAS